MEVPKWLKQFPTALNKPCAAMLPHTDLHTYIRATQDSSRPSGIPAQRRPMQRHQLT